MFLVGQSSPEGPCVQSSLTLHLNPQLPKATDTTETQQCVMVPSSSGPPDASCYSLTFKNSKEIRENHKLAIIKLVLA